MKNLKLTLLFFALVVPFVSFATVDFLSVNKITKEYYWGDDDRSPGWIGWKYVPEGQLDTAEADLIKLGYSETFYPYKLETYAVLGIFLLMGIFLMINKRRVKV